MSARRVGVIGAGIVGLSVARRLLLDHPGLVVEVLEKEAAVAVHQTGRNSGVAHAGVYYPPGSEKARLCVAGVGQLRDYCQAKGLEFEECGKLIVAVDQHEIPGLRTILERGTANGVPGLRWLDGNQLREVEPHAVGVAAVHSPTTAIVDFAAVSRQLAADVRELGGTVRLGSEVLGLGEHPGGMRVTTSTGDQVYDLVVACAGLQADRVARMANDHADPMIIPFRGEYLALRPDRTHLVRGLIYPVPDPRYPFLGVHLTRQIGGGVTVGPNAVLAFSREGYRRSQIRPRDLLETLGWPGFRQLARQHWRTGVAEFAGSISKRRFVAKAQRYVPELRPADVVASPAGVRAQAVDAAGGLVDDFRITRQGHVVIVRNAPSPAATSALAIADHIVSLLELPAV